MNKMLNIEQTSIVNNKKSTKIIIMVDNANLFQLVLYTATGSVPRVLGYVGLAMKDIGTLIAVLVRREKNGERRERHPPPPHLLLISLFFWF
jgi:hypothetical protein